MYTCAIISTIASIGIALNILGIVVLPRPGGTSIPIGSGGRFDWKYFLTFNVFPVLILFNLMFWVFTTVSGRTFTSRPGVRQALQVFYTLITVLLLGILAFLML